MEELEDYQNNDEYVVGCSNTSHLISSLNQMLREDKYLSLYDTSILSLPEEHLKKLPYEKIIPHYLTSWLSFFAGIERILISENNLIIMPEVGEEMQNLIAGTLSTIDKKKLQFKALTTQQKEMYQKVYENIYKNEEILLRIQTQLGKRRSPDNLEAIAVFDQLLDLIKKLDGLLELKKPSSRKGNDTDERICARAFFKMAVHGYNVAIYTRDDDIRKLVSATYKFLTSRKIKEKYSFRFLQNISHLNIIVFKYHYEKHVFCRFFESSTDMWNGDFRFPPKLAGKTEDIYEDIEEILQNIENTLTSTKCETPLPEPPKFHEDVSQDRVNKILQGLLRSICKLPIQETVPAYRAKIDIFRRLDELGDALGEKNLQEEIADAREQSEQFCLQSLIAQLKRDQLELQKKYEQISKEQLQEISHLQNVAAAATASWDNLQKISFFEDALHLGLFDLSDEKYYHRFKEFLERFRQNNIIIGRTETSIPQEKIAEIAQLNVSETIQIIEQYKIPYQSMHVYLSQATLLYFL